MAGRRRHGCGSSDYDARIILNDNIPSDIAVEIERNGIHPTGRERTVEGAVRVEANHTELTALARAVDKPGNDDLPIALKGDAKTLVERARRTERYHAVAAPEGAVVSPGGLDSAGDAHKDCTHEDGEQHLHVG